MFETIKQTTFLRHRLFKYLFLLVHSTPVIQDSPSRLPSVFVTVKLDLVYIFLLFILQTMCEQKA